MKDLKTKDSKTECPKKHYFGFMVALVFLSFGGVSCGTNPHPSVSQRHPDNHIDGWGDLPDIGAQFTPVTNALGPLVVAEGEFYAESQVKPWSSWWFPANDSYLFETKSSRKGPLVKYDEYSKKIHGKETKAAAYERDHVYNAAADSWEGLCNAWAIASLVEPEPTRPAKLRGFSFGVGDLKALLVKSYEKAEGLSHFGQRYNGAPGDEFGDILPDQFHRFLQAELFEKGRPFIMDKDPGVAVWNTPVWKANIVITKDAVDPRVMHVAAALVGADPWVDSYDFLGTRAVQFNYDYNLYGNIQADGTFLVKYGEWKGDSLDYHPDFLTAVPAQKPVHASRNPEFDSAIVGELLDLARNSPEN